MASTYDHSRPDYCYKMIKKIRDSFPLCTAIIIGQESGGIPRYLAVMLKMPSHCELYWITISSQVDLNDLMRQIKENANSVSTELWDEVISGMDILGWRTLPDGPCRQQFTDTYWRFVTTYIQSEMKSIRYFTESGDAYTQLDKIVFENAKTKGVHICMGTIPKAGQAATR